MTPPVAVIGGSLAGLAAAARLAAAGHEVVLFERETHLGGRWSPAGDPAPDILPPVIALPAPWRDLFRKTGRTLDAELAARGLALTPAPAATHELATGRLLTLPTDRADQATALTAATTAEAAAAWRDLLDDLDDTWQVLRPLGLEAEFPADFPRSLPASARDNLSRHRSLLAVAARFPAELRPIVTSGAWRIGSDPRRTPGWTAARLAVERAFGRWCVTDAAGAPQPAGVLIDLLAARLATRGVDVRLATPVTGAAGTTLATPDGTFTAAAVVTTVHPWQPTPLGSRGPLLRPLRPALAPTVTHTVTPGTGSGPEGATEHVRHTAAGPIVTFTRRTPAGTVTTVHDHTRRTPDPSLGARWAGPATWTRMPRLRAAPGWYTAGPAGPGGTDPWAQLLSGALAVYALHADLTGEDIRPANRAYRPRIHRRPR